jgi:hypothetical protein
MAGPTSSKKRVHHEIPASQAVSEERRNPFEFNSEEGSPPARQRKGRQTSVAPSQASMRSSSRLSAQKLKELDQLNSREPASDITVPVPAKQVQPNLGTIHETDVNPPAAKKAKKPSKPKAKQLSTEEVDTFRSALPFLQNLGPMMENITQLLADKGGGSEPAIQLHPTLPLPPGPLLPPPPASRASSRASSRISSRASSRTSLSSRSRVSSVASIPLIPPLDLPTAPNPIHTQQLGPSSTHLTVPHTAAHPLHYAMNSFGTDPYSSDLYKRWPWVDKVHIASIIVGELDINNLPKLFRDDQSRRKHNIHTATGMLFPLGGGPAEFVQSQTKLQTVFHNLTTFLSAFMVYISIRATFAPEYGSTMTLWVERIMGYTAKGSWPPVLAYVIDFFQRYQNAPASKWLDIDGELVALHFSFANTTPSIPHTAKSPSKAISLPSKKGPERCKNFNRPNGCSFPATHNGRACPRSHVCWGCGDANHLSPNCPTKPGPPPFNE